MGVIKTATTKTAKISGRQQYSRSASPLDENAPGMGGGNGVSGNGMSLEEVQRYCKEPLTAHEAHILQKQVERLEKEGKVGRALNIAMFTRSCVLAFRKTGERPPAVSEGPWNKYLEDGSVVDLRRSFTPEQSAFWEYRSKILQAHHAVTFPDYKFRPKHLTREEKEIKIAEKNRKRVARGESPLPTTLPRRGRPAKLKATASAPAHLITSAAPPRSGRGVSPTSSTSRPGSPRLAPVVDMARPAPLQFTPFDPSGMRNSRDDGAALYEFGRRRSSATHYYLRGQVTTDPRRTIDLPGGMSGADFSAPFGSATGPFGGAGLGLDAPLPMQGELFGQQAGPSRGTRKPTSLEDGLVPNISQRRNSEFMPLPFPTIVPPHVPAVSHNMFGGFSGFGQIPEFGAEQQQQQQDSIWTNTNPFAASMPVGQTTPTLYDGFVGMAPHQRVPAPVPFGNAAAPTQEYIAPSSEPVYAPAEYSYAGAGETQALQFGWDASAVADHNPLNLTLDIPAAAESQDYDAGFEFIQTHGFESSESSPGSTEEEFLLY